MVGYGVGIDAVVWVGVVAGVVVWVGVGVWLPLVMMLGGGGWVGIRGMKKTLVVVVMAGLGKG